MELIAAERTVDYPYLRLVSENQVWELGIGQLTVYGDFQVVAGIVGSQSFEVTYYAGQDRGMALGILAQVLIIMVAMPESISYSDFRKAFPPQEKIPMINDPKCWEALSNTAKLVTPENYQMVLRLQENFPGVEKSPVNKKPAP
jgi:hypothetical protein